MPVASGAMRQRPALVRVGVERVGAVGVEDREQRLGDVFEVAGRELLGLLGEELGDLAALLVLQVGRDTAQGADGDVEVLAGDPAVGQRLHRARTGPRRVRWRGRRPRRDPTRPACAAAAATRRWTWRRRRWPPCGRRPRPAAAGRRPRWRGAARRSRRTHRRVRRRPGSTSRRARTRPISPWRCGPARTPPGCTGGGVDCASMTTTLDATPDRTRRQPATGFPYTARVPGHLLSTSDTKQTPPSTDQLTPLDNAAVASLSA